MVKSFKILLHQPPSGPAYFPGTEVSGTLVVEVDKPKNYNAIVIYLTGMGYVHWTETRSSGNRRTRTVHYTANETHVHLQSVVWSKDQAIDGMLAAGEHHYQFRFLLPPNIPSSFEVHGGPGWIRYGVVVEINRKFPKPNLKIDRTRLQVVEIVHISADSLRMPFHLEKQKTAGCLCCKSAPIVTTVEVPRSGYCVGEEIPFQVTVENSCSKPVRVTAVLQERRIYTAQGRRRYVRNNSHVSRGSVPIEPHSTTVWAPEVEGIKIPVTTPTTLNTRIIQRNFYLSFTTHIPNVCSNPTLVVPLTIGNVPYNQDPPTFGATAPPGPPIPFLPPLPQTTPELTSFDPPSYQDAVTNY